MWRAPAPVIHPVLSQMHDLRTLAHTVYATEFILEGNVTIGAIVRDWLVVFILVKIQLEITCTVLIRFRVAFIRKVVPSNIIFTTPTMHVSCR